MPNQIGIDDHSNNAEALAEGYAKIDRHKVHPDFFEMLQKASDAGNMLEVLDIGAGSGNDAAVMANMGHHVTAIEPSALREIAMRDNNLPNIAYVNDTLPELTSLGKDKKFDAVLLSAVWQYIDPGERIPALKRIAESLARNGRLRITFQSPPSRAHQFEISTDTFNAELEAANKLLPPSQQLELAREPIITDDVRGRTTDDGRLIKLVQYELSPRGITKATQIRNSAVAGR